jgi:hypothetical protein
MASQGRLSKVKRLNRQQRRALFDARVRNELHMSGEEFVRQWKSGVVRADRASVLRVAMLLPLAR